MDQEPWYAAKCLFRHHEKESGPKQMYEERAILLKATSLDEAVGRAESEAKLYCMDLQDCEFTGYVDVFHLYDENLVDGSELFSSMRRSDLKPEEYLDHFYPDEPEDCETGGVKHRWHNLDDKRSACYHCGVVRDRQL
jgi:hypothetical protein